MTQMIDALKNAGVPLPTNRERVWRSIKEQPGQRLAELQKRLVGINPNSISSSVVALEYAGMVYSRPGPKGIKQFFTDLDVYYKERKPIERKPKPKAVASPLDTLPPVQQPVKSVPRVNLEGLTIGEARDLYQQLKKMFG